MSSEPKSPGLPQHGVAAGPGVASANANQAPPLAGARCNAEPKPGPMFGRYRCPPRLAAFTKPAEAHGPSPPPRASFSLRRAGLALAAWAVAGAGLVWVDQFLLDGAILAALRQGRGVLQDVEGQVSDRVWGEGTVVLIFVAALPFAALALFLFCFLPLRARRPALLACLVVAVFVVARLGLATLGEVDSLRGCLVVLGLGFLVFGLAGSGLMPVPLRRPALWSGLLASGVMWVILVFVCAPVFSLSVGGVLVVLALGRIVLWPLLPNKGRKRRSLGAWAGAVWTVIVRELRVQSRRPATFWLRMLAAALVLGSGVMLWKDMPLPVGAGLQVFAGLQHALFVSIWLLVPLLTADCLSYERREGTLSLLFLTPLRPPDIVLAKGLVNSLRGLTLLLAALPMLTVPLLLGGVSWEAVVTAAVCDLCSLGLALAAGVLASSFCIRLSTAVVMALVWSVVAYGLFFIALSLGFALGEALRGSWGAGQSLGYVLPYFADLLGEAETWNHFLSHMSASGNQATYFLGLVSASFFSGLALVLAVGHAARRLDRYSRDQGLSPLAEWFQRTLCVPVVWRSQFRAWMRRSLERNPVGWLERRSWNGRLMGWVWLSVGTSFCMAGLFGGAQLYRDEDQLLDFLAVAMVSTMALNAVNSFRRERENGVMELLLVSPMTERRIIFGRLGGLWGQFLPGFTALAILWGYLASVHLTSPVRLWYFGTTFLTLPVFGLYCSLRFRHFVVALVCAVGLVVVGPLVVQVVVRPGLEWVMQRFYPDAVTIYFQKTTGLRPPPTTPTGFLQTLLVILPILMELALALLLLWRLERLLKQRRFVERMG